MTDCREQSIGGGVGRSCGGPKVVDMLTRLKANQIGGPVSDASELSPYLVFTLFLSFLSLGRDTALDYTYASRIYTTWDD